MPPSHPDALTRVFVYGATVVMCAAAGWYTHKYGTDLPVRDEWYLVPQWLASDSTGEWAVAHHNEHRYPLNKLLWLGVVRASGNNLKAPMYGTVGLLTAAAVLLQWAAGRVRGRVHPLDALYPVLLLHWGNGLNLIFGYQIGHALFVYALAGWAWAAGRLATGGGPGWGVLSVLYVSVVVTCGGYGLAFTPPVLAWLVYLAVRYARAGRWGWAGGFAAAGLAVGGYSGWVYATMPPPLVPGISPTADPGGFAAGMVAFLRLGVGDLDEWGGWSTPLGVVLCLEYVVAVGLAGWRAVRGEQRAVWVAVLGIVFGTLAIGAAVVRGRGAMTEWYVTASAVGLAAAVFAVTHDPAALFVRGSLRRVLSLSGGGWRASLGWAVVAGLLGGGIVWANHKFGNRMASLTRVSLADMRADIAAGYPPSFIVGRHGSTYPVIMGDNVTTFLTAFHEAGWPQFRTVGPEPPVVLVPVDGVWVPVHVSNFPARGVGEVRLPDPPPRALAVRLRTTSVDSAGWQQLAVKWTDADTGAEHSASATPPYLSGQTTHLVFPLTGRPTALRLVPVGIMKVVRIEAADWLVLPLE